ncbi:hypothetical protein VISI1226_07458 [Vibrio sinaloensis DSM 21326]|uniref:Uncharacterized protein n=1 Tax=Vibrio sinaloensis DSM 21326 TaxID=945550 RepID=E8MAH6_PHOS4|nr:hypothetical protein [Vibrio sinaloensis]EGA69125.1 hypothetical protein VISI1226_07458 [Vibrio sinaloensis DSM 21326]
MVKYLSVRGEQGDLQELSKMLKQHDVDNYVSEVKQFSTSASDIVTLLINTAPNASIASVLIARIRMKQNRKVYIQYVDNTSVTLEGHHSKEEVEYYFNQKERAQIIVESDSDEIEK